MKTSLRNTYSKIFRYDQSVKSNMKYDPGIFPILIQIGSREPLSESPVQIVIE
jgi:hypothetical protein